MFYSTAASTLLRARSCTFGHSTSLQSPRRDVQINAFNCSDSENTTAMIDVAQSPASRKSNIPRKNILSDIRWFNLSVVILTPIASLYGLATTSPTRATIAFSLAYYVFNMIGITAGYHRLWSHRAYNATLPLQYFLALAGAGAVQGSIRWWARGHRSHHRYTDTDLDPYNASRGLFWTHIGWMLVKPQIKPGKTDVRDLSQSPVVQWQHQWYFPLALIFGILLPTCIPGFFWNDWRGGLYTAGFLRLTLVHHSTFSVNSIAHWLGEATYDDKHTPRDHLLTAIVTLGEGYHNFHHQFPADYRNGVRWHDYDPTKWFIALCSRIGLARDLRAVPVDIIEMGALSMTLKRLKVKQDKITWPPTPEDLPVVTWETFREESTRRCLVLVAGFIHDISDFVDHHPGGQAVLHKVSGTDATAAFFGGVYEHSHAAHNLLATMRVGILHGGVEQAIAHAIPPGRKLLIAEHERVNLS